MQNDSAYFPKNYADSRQIFLNQIEQLPAPKTIGSWEIPSKTDSDLFVDHVWLPATEKPEKLFVITSGIHGSETYAGAAIQRMFFAEIFPQINRRTTGVFVVHAMNPYGFKHHQRCTESNINLNRNFSVSGEIYRRKDETSAKLSERFLDRNPVSSMRSRLMDSMTMKNGEPFFDEYPLDDIVKGLIPGQFEFVENWEFGGLKAEPQTKFFIERLSQLMPDFKDVIGFDLHTGLGDRNRLHLLTDGPGSPSINKSLFAELFFPQEDAEIYAFTPPTAKGFYPVHGALNSAFGELAKPEQRVCSITMEFGTFGHSMKAQLDGLNCFAVAHQGQMHGFANKDIEKKILSDNFERSRPASAEWEQAVVQASRGLFLKVLSRSGVSRF